MFVEHVMRAVMALAGPPRRAGSRQVIAEGAAAEVMRHPDVVTAYLGSAACLSSRLEAAYGDATALWGVSLTVETGELVCVVGPNGAGKSTLINAIAGLLPLAAGAMPLGRRGPHPARRRTGSAPRASRSCPRGAASSPR